MRFAVIYRKKEYNFRMDSYGDIGRAVGINWTDYILTNPERNAIKKAGGNEEIKEFLENSSYNDVKKVGAIRIINLVR